MKDEQLKLALAKILPESVHVHEQESIKTFWWKGEDYPSGRQIRDTEWLHVCWLVEQEMMRCEGGQRWLDYINLIGESSCWQERAIALCKVKGVEI